MRTPILTDRRPVVVRVGRRALFDMLLAAVESATVPPQMRSDSEMRAAALERFRRRRSEFARVVPMSLLHSVTGLPAAGILLGRQRDNNTAVEFEVEGMVARSANRHDFGLWTNPASPAVIAEVVRASGAADIEVIGEFRSRPFLDKTPDEIGLSRNYQWRRTRDTAPEFAGDRVSIKMTITRRTASIPMLAARNASVVQFQTGDWEVWVAALLPDRRMPTQGPTLLIDLPPSASSRSDT